MGYKLRKAPKRDLYWVVAQDGTKKSKDPLPKERAEAQRRALYAAENQKMKGGQITDEQIAEYAPTLQAALPEFQAGPEPTRGDYERYKKGVEKSQKRGMTTRLMSYDEWANLQRTREKERQTGVKAAQKSIAAELPGLVEGWDSLKADPLVMCPYDSKGNVQKTSMRQSECKAARDEWEKREHPENYYFFRPAVTGLVKAADFAAENIAPMLPGVGKLAGELYKGVRDVVGPTEYDGAGYKHLVRARRVGGRRIAMRGDGFFGDLWASTKRVASTALERAQAVFKGPRQDFSPSVRKVLAEVGQNPVVEMVVRRDPIQSLLNKALNFVSLGRWDKLRKEYNYDELFHLGVEVTVRLSESNNYTRRYVIEKNEVINVSPAKAYTDKTQTWRVHMNGSTTIDKLLANTKLLMGSKFFVYDPFKNNCQDFIWSLLTANGYASPELKAVVKQPMEDLVAKLPASTGKIAKTITDIGALANVALEGQGKKQSELAQSVMIKNTMKNNLKTLEDEYVRLYLAGEIAEAEELYKLIKESRKAFEDAQDAFAFKDLPKMSPGAAADWSTPRGKGKASRVSVDTPSSRFAAQLEKEKVSPQKYLAMAKRAAKKAGYDPKTVGFSHVAGKKLMVEGPSGPVHIGAVGSGDFLIYSLQGDKSKAAEKQRLYLARATRIQGDWREDPYSANKLAIQILWSHVI